MVKIYTKKGDDGTTGLWYGGRVDKSDLRTDAYGTLDEACSELGGQGAITVHVGDHELVPDSEGAGCERCDERSSDLALGSPFCDDTQVLAARRVCFGFPRGQELDAIIPRRAWLHDRPLHGRTRRLRVQRGLLDGPPGRRRGGDTLRRSHQ